MGKYELSLISMTRNAPLSQLEQAEDYLLLKQVDRARKLLARRLDRLYRLAAHAEHKLTAQRFYDSLDDAAHDASFGLVLEESAEAWGRTTTAYTRYLVKDERPICLTCGNVLDELTTSKNAADRGEQLCNHCERERVDLEEREASCAE